MRKKIAVIYHGDCLDGFTGAWVAWRKFGAKAQYIPTKDRLRPPKGLAGKEIFIIDLAYPLETMTRMLRSAKRVVVLDHHESAADAVQGMPEHRYATDRSGAVLAWEYFFPDKPVPKLLMHVQDQDLWRLELPHTLDIRAYLEVTPFEFPAWTKAVRDLERAPERREIIAKGAMLLAHKRELVGDIAGQAEKVRFEGYAVLAVNSPVFSDELGDLLARKRPPFAIVWRRKGDGSIRVSLRARSGFDVSRIAVKYGGGGHPGSAGFSIPTGMPLPWERVK